MNARLTTLAFVVVLVCSLPAGIGGLESVHAAGSPGGDGSSGGYQTVASVGTATVTSGSADVIHRTTVLRHRPADPSVFETEMTFQIPDSVTALEVELADGAAVASTTGFERTGDRTLEWTGETDQPSVRYTMPADRRGSGRQGVNDSAGDYTFVDTGDWGVVPVPGVALRYQGTTPVGTDETVRIDGPGATGGDIAFFGPVEEYERAVDGGTIRLAVPEAVTLEESPEAILTALADARERLTVGERRDEVFMVAVPNDVDWGSKRGLKYGQADAWVVEDATLDERNPTWLHEYVHIRQRFASTDADTTAEADWLVEAQADYYAGLLALEDGETDFEAFSGLLERGERLPYADAVLTDRSTWTDAKTDYAKGALVYGEIDRQLRVATDGDRTLEDVFRSLNAQDGQITQRAFLQLVEDYGGSDVRAVAERYTQTEATPQMWNRSQHAAAFDQPVADFTYGSDADGLEVAGQAWPRWNATDLAGTGGAAGDVLAVPVGESVTVPVTVDNVGARGGTYDATLQVDGQVVDQRRGTLAAGAGTSHRLSWTPDEPGTYTVRVGSEQLTVVVRSAASVTVTDLRVAPDGVAPGEPVTATATVETADDRPAAAVLAFRTIDGVVAERPVALRPGESTTVTATLRFEESSRYQVAVGNRTTVVSVGNDGLAAARDAVPGFGVPVALVAVVMALTGAVLGRRR